MFSKAIASSKKSVGPDFPLIDPIPNLFRRGPQVHRRLFRI